MKEIILDALVLTNFKGIKSKTIAFNDGLTTIYGDNATGKTTIFDAFTWLLFDKDSLNRKDFGIKTYDETGKTIQGADHVVEAAITVDGQAIKLMKVYKEVWTKKRGRSQAEFTGHKTEYYINSVPIKKSEYDNRIKTIIEDQKFKLLTNPLFFNEQLDRKDRRDLILSLEDISSQDVIKSMDKEPQELVKQLDDYSLDEIKAMSKATMRKLNKDIEDLPVRIDELINQKLDHDWKSLEEEKKNLQNELSLLSGEIDDVEGIMSVFESKMKALNDKKRRLYEIELNNDRQSRIEYEKEKSRYDEAIAEQKKLRKKIADFESMKDLEDADRKKINQKIDEARNSWVKLNATQPPSGATCESCGQSLPETQLEKMVKEFNQRKSVGLENYYSIGIRHKEELQSFDEDCKKRQEELEHLKSKKIEIPAEPIFRKPELPIEYYELEAEIKAQEQELSEEKSVINEDDLKIKRRESSSRISEIDELLGQKKRNEEIEKRINDLKGQEKELASEYEKQELLQYQIDSFIRAKVELVSAKINAHFEMVKFKLFDEQINGELNETCEVTIDGVPYSDLNNASKINAGLDVINTLSKIFKTQAPIFVDNAESVNELIKTKSQMIRLVVSNDKTLRVE